MSNEKWLDEGRSPVIINVDYHDDYPVPVANWTKLADKIGRAVIAVSGLSNTLVDAISGYKIKLLSLYLVASGATLVRFTHNGDAITGWFTLDAAGAKISLPLTPIVGSHHIECAVGEALVLEQTTDDNYLGGLMTYFQE